MSVATRRVGEARGISLQSLSEELFVEPAPGRVESGSPTRKAVRNALAQLEKHGLIQACGNGEVLVFLLPKVEIASARQKLKGHKRGTVSGHAIGHGDSLAEQAFPDETGHAIGHGVNGLKGHTSEVRVNSQHKQTTSHTHTPVDNFQADDVLPLLTDAGIADWIRRREAKREKVARVTAADVAKVGWITRAISAERIAEAYWLAVANRDATKNQAPINVPYLDSLVCSVLGGGRSAGKHQADQAGGNTSLLSQAIATAERIGVAGRSDGESESDFIRRVLDDAEAHRLGVEIKMADESPADFLGRLSAARGASRRRKHG